MMLSGEITLVRDNKGETFRAGDHCEIRGGMPAHRAGRAGGVAYIVGKACRRPAAN